MDFTSREFNERLPYGFHVEKPLIMYKGYTKMEELKEYVENLPKKDKEELERLYKIFEV